MLSARYTPKYPPHLLPPLPLLIPHRPPFNHLDARATPPPRPPNKLIIRPSLPHTLPLLPTRHNRQSSRRRRRTSRVTSQHHDPQQGSLPQQLQRDEEPRPVLPEEEGKSEEGGSHDGEDGGREDDTGLVGFLGEEAGVGDVGEEEWEEVAEDGYEGEESREGAAGEKGAEEFGVGVGAVEAEDGVFCFAVSFCEAPERYEDEGI